MDKTTEPKEKRNRRVVLGGLALLTATAIGATLLNNSYPHFNIFTGDMETIVSSYDIPNSELTISQVNGINRYEVTVPATSPLSEGNFVVRMLFGNPDLGTVSREVIATFGDEALIGGDFPLAGGGGVVLDNLQPTNWIADAAATIEPSQLRLDVDPASLGGAELMYVEFFGTDELNVPPGVVPAWFNIPKQVLYRNVPPGAFVIGTLPGNQETSYPFGPGGASNSPLVPPSLN